MKIEDIRFNINEELSNTLLELLVIRQMLKENQLNIINRILSSSKN